MLLSLDEVVCVNVDDVAADGLGGVEGEGEVLNLGINAGTGFLVHSTLIDRLGARMVDDFPGEKQMLQNCSKGLILRKIA